MERYRRRGDCYRWLSEPEVLHHFRLMRRSIPLLRQSPPSFILIKELIYIFLFAKVAPYSAIFLRNRKKMQKKCYDATLLNILKKGKQAVEEYQQKEK